MFETIHFTNLKHLATRDKIERGARYLHCSDFRETPNFFDYASGNDIPRKTLADSYEIFTASGLVRFPMAHGMPPLPHGRVRSDTMAEIHPMFAVLIPPSWRSTKRVSWNFASDNGLWDLPDISYKNRTNYLLNINELLRLGITIDTSPIVNPNGRG
jgi:hypothetical protein